MRATAMGDSQSATHVVCVVLPSLHLKHAMLPLGTPSLEHTALFYKFWWVTRHPSWELEQGQWPWLLVQAPLWPSFKAFPL